MAFLKDKILEGEHVILRHVTPDDAEAILAAWHAEPTGKTEVGSLIAEVRALAARAVLLLAEWIHPFAKAKFCGPQVSSTWRHHRPPSIHEEREILYRLERSEDRYQFLIIRKETSEIIGCIGFKTNPSQNDGLTANCLENLRVARLGMLLFREDPWDHRCEREAIRLMLDTIFRQEFRKSDDSLNREEDRKRTHFRIIDVVIPVNMEDEVTLGVLMSLGFRHSVKSFKYHGRMTRILEYVPQDIDPKDC